MDISKDISLIDSDNENSMLVQSQNEQSLQFLISDLQNQITCKNKIIIELEADVSAHKQRIDHFENSSQELQEMIASLKDKLNFIEQENILFKSLIENLNLTIKNQKEHLESANNDITSYNSLIQELQIKLTNKDRIIGQNINDSVLQKMIDNEEKFIANNENIKNIVHSLQTALDSRDKEIGLLKSNLQNTHNSGLQKELDAKIKENDDLKCEIHKLNNQIDKHVCNTNISIEDKNNWTILERNLTENIILLEKEKEDLQSSIKEKDTYIENLKEKLDCLSHGLLDKTSSQTDIFDTSQKLLQQVTDKSDVMSKSENIKENSSIQLQEENQETQKHLHQAKVAVIKLQAIVPLLTKSTPIFPKIIDDFENITSALHDTTNMLETIATDYITKHDEIKILLSTKDSELLENHIEISKLRNKMEEMVDENNHLLEELRLELKSKNKTILNFEQEQNKATSSEKLETLGEEINTLNNLLKSKEISFEQTLLEKENNIENLLKNLKEVKKELSQKCSALDSATEQITDIHTQVNQAQNDRDQLMVDILGKVNSLTNEFNIENNLSCQFMDGNTNTYEQIILTLDKIRTYINLLGLENVNTDSQRENLEQILTEAKKEITELTKQNLELREKLFDLESKSAVASTKIEEIRIENEDLNKNLITSQQLLHQLKHELALKAGELQIMEVKAKRWKNEFINFDQQIKEQMEEMHIENERLKICCQHDNTETSLNNVKDGKVNNLDDMNTGRNTVQYSSPPSLLTICCNTIFDSIQPKGSESKSIISTMSSTDIELEKTHKCQCEQLSTNLDMLKNQCSELTLNIQQLKKENKRLLEEQEEVRTELELLIGPAFELQKKLANHRTNLSILTATTYAENKLLKSQLKVLQHHHDRVHNVCRKDLTIFKMGLHDLMTILKETDNSKDLAIKRYSLPDILDKNTTLTNFKNESTLDGDLLMLDTNVTLTTTDNTLVGYDQTCLDLTQNLFIEASCQTNNLSQSVEYNIELLNTDNQIIYEKFELLKEENGDLRNELNNLISINSHLNDEVTNLRISTSVNENVSLPSKACLDCQNNMEKITNYNKISEEKENIYRELLFAKNQKDHIDQKYKQLSLEMSSTNELVTKFNNLQKDYNDKLQEISKLTVTINDKNNQIKDLLQENDVFSTQVMENVSELDDLSKKLENCQLENTELTEKCSKLNDELELLRKINTEHNQFICQQCALKSEPARSRQRKSLSETHTKLNRSYSDSDTSSRYNKICTLQNELHAGREDCIELTEDVTTIKNHLDRSNLSMDLDVTIGDPSVFSCAKDISVGSQPNTCNMPEIPEECQTDTYSAEKTDCINYYVQNCGKTIENLNPDIKIIEVMTMLYNDLTTKHINEVENLGNKIKDLDESKRQMHYQIENLLSECSKLKVELTEMQPQSQVVFIKIKNNLNLLQSILFGANNNTDIYSKALVFFKDNVLKIIDSEFETSVLSAFEVLINAVLTKHERELSEVINKYCTLEKDFAKVTADLTTVKENLAQMEVQLHGKEEEYSLLKAQKDSVFEISNAITKDLLRKEREINTLILQSCQKLKEENVIDIESIDADNTVINNLHLLFEETKKKIITQLKNKKEISEQEFKKYEHKLNLKESELRDLKACYKELEENNNSIKLSLMDKENTLQTINDLHENLQQLYNNKVKENITNIALIEELTSDIENFKEIVKAKEQDLLAVSDKEMEITKLLNTLSELNEQNQRLKDLNAVITKERDSYKSDLEKSLARIDQNKIVIDKMNSDILVLKESVKNNTEVVDSLNNEAKLLLAQNLELKNKFDEKCLELSKLQINVKTHLKTAEVQTKIISRSVFTCLKKNTKYIYSKF